MKEVDKVLITDAGMQVLQDALENPAEPTPELVELLCNAQPLQLPEDVQILGS